RCPRAVIGDRGDAAAGSGGQAGAGGRELAGQADLLAVRSRQAELARTLLDPGRRAQRGHLDLELADVRLHFLSLPVQAVQLVGEVHLLHPQPDHAETAADQRGREQQGPEERAAYARILFAMQSLLSLHGNRSSTRSFALRARGLARTSSSPGSRGDGSSAANPAASRLRNVRFTMRSSPE